MYFFSKTHDDEDDVDDNSCNNGHENDNDDDKDMMMMKTIMMMTMIFIILWWWRWWWWWRGWWWWWQCYIVVFIFMMMTKTMIMMMMIMTNTSCFGDMLHQGVNETTRSLRIHIIGIQRMKKVVRQNWPKRFTERYSSSDLGPGWREVLLIVFQVQSSWGASWRKAQSWKKSVGVCLLFCQFGSVR